MKIIQIYEIKYSQKNYHLIIIVWKRREIEDERKRRRRRKRKDRRRERMMIDRNMTLFFLLMLLLKLKKKKFLFFFPSLHCSLLAAVISRLFSASFSPMAYIDYLFVCVPSLNTRKKERSNYVWVPSGLIEDDCQWFFSSYRFLVLLYGKHMPVVLLFAFIKYYHCCVSNMKRKVWTKREHQRWEYLGRWVVFLLYVFLISSLDFHWNTRVLQLLERIRK